MNKYIVSTNPHQHSQQTIERIMWSVVLALLPTLITSIIFFRSSALITIAISVASAVGSEFLYRRLLKKSFTISDGSAVVTGLLFASILPASIPWWIPALGSSIAIIIFKEASGGGLGKNIFNPALAAYAVLSLLLPNYVSVAVTPFSLTVTTAEPSIMQDMLSSSSSFWNMFSGNHAGTLAGTSDIALLIGGVFLLYRSIIKWYYPACFILTFAVVSALCGRSPITEVFTGPVLLCAFFMITDTVTTPITLRGGIIFSVAAALIAAIFRTFSSFTDSLCFGILLMNACVPLIDRWTQPRMFGFSVSDIPLHTPRTPSPEPAGSNTAPSTAFARVFCRGGAAAVDDFTYVGIQTCRAASLVFQGQKFCKFGCLGFGDCQTACRFGALTLGPDKLPVIDEKKCVACGQCVAVCPKQVIAIHARSETVFVQCKSRDKGTIVRKICTRGCTGCELCVPECPVGAICVTENRATIDQEKCTRCGACIRVCPTRVLVDLSS